MKTLDFLYNASHSFLYLKPNQYIKYIELNVLITLLSVVVLFYQDLMGDGVCSTGNEGPTSRSLISEFIRPLQISGDKPELLSVKPTFLSRSRASSPARAFLSEVLIGIRSDPPRFFIQGSSVPYPVYSLQ